MICPVSVMEKDPYFRYLPAPFAFAAYHIVQAKHAEKTKLLELNDSDLKKRTEGVGYFWYYFGQKTPGSCVTGSKRTGRRWPCYRKRWRRWRSTSRKPPSTTRGRASTSPARSGRPRYETLVVRSERPGALGSVRYARTLKSDDCHLAVPEWFDSDSRKWAGGYVRDRACRTSILCQTRSSGTSSSRTRPIAAWGSPCPHRWSSTTRARPTSVSREKVSRSRGLCDPRRSHSPRRSVAYPGPSCHPGLPSLDDLKAPTSRNLRPALQGVGCGSV